jgi:hypothetical protein
MRPPIAQFPALLAAASLVALQPATASADPLSAAPGLSGPIGPPPDAGAHVHDGFYFRVAQSFGVYDERLQSQEFVNGGTIEARNRGMATVSDLAIGGTIAPGWVIGGGIYSLDLIASTFRTSEDSVAVVVPEELDPGLRSLSLIAPFVDWYPNVHGGFHAQAALGLATLTPRLFGHPATDNSEYLALGAGLLIGTGYEWWVADEWSIGVLGQLGFRVLTGKDDAGVRWTHIITNSPTLGVTLTYH